MSSKRTGSMGEARGRVQFIIKAEDEALEIRLDRPGFQRLLRTLETLAQVGGEQNFEQSGRKYQSRDVAASGQITLTKITFHIDQPPARTTTH